MELEISDFSGGETDFYVDGHPSQGALYRNLLIDLNRKAYTRPGSEHYDDELFQVPSGASRIKALKYFNGTLFRQVGSKLYYTTTEWKDLVGPVNSVNPFQGSHADDRACFVEWRDHLFVTCSKSAANFSNNRTSVKKIYKDGTGVWQVRTAGLPKEGGFTVTLTAGANSVSYIYALIYVYEYQVGTITYRDFGPPTYLQVTSSSAEEVSAVNTASIQGVTALANGTTECYDTANVKIRVYRTTDGGSVLRFAKEVPNTSGTVIDDIPDASLGDSLYTDGGIAPNDPPPLCHYMTVTSNDIGWYGNIKEGSEELPYRLRQAIQNDLDSCPEDFYVDLPRAINGLGSIDIYPIVFCSDGSKYSMYRIEGQFQRSGEGYLVPRLISDTVGCISHGSIVKVRNGLFFAAEDGFYYTDGFKIQKVSKNLEKRYRTATENETQRYDIVGVLDPITERVYWTMRSNKNETHVDMVRVMEPRFGVTESTPFTHFDGGEGYESNFCPTALEVIDGNLVRADRRGYTFIHRETIFSDPVIDHESDIEDWAVRGVDYHYISSAFSFGSKYQRKYVTKLVTVQANETNISCQPASINDDSGIEKDLKEIKFSSAYVWGDENIIWGDEIIVWNHQGLIISERHFPKGGLRCTHKQVVLKPSNTIIDKSDVIGTATVDSGNLTVLLENLAFEWPLNATNMQIYFEDDGYVNGYQIVARTDDTLTVTDPNNSLTDGSKKWVIRSKPYQEIMRILTITIIYELFGQSLTGYQKGGDNANA